MFNDYLCSYVDYAIMHKLYHKSACPYHSWFYFELAKHDILLDILNTT